MESVKPSDALRNKEVHGMKNRDGKSSDWIWYMAGGAALAVVAVGFILNISDIKRYIKITKM